MNVSKIPHGYLSFQFSSNESESKIVLESVRKQSDGDFIVKGRLGAQPMIWTSIKNLKDYLELGAQEFLRILSEASVSLVEILEFEARSESLYQLFIKNKTPEGQIHVVFKDNSIKTSEGVSMVFFDEVHMLNFISDFGSHISIEQPTYSFWANLKKIDLIKVLSHA